MAASSSPHAIVPGSERVALPGARALGRTNSAAVINVTVKLRRRRELPPLDGKARTPMTRAALAKTYGASAADAETVAAVLSGFGLTVVSTNLATRSIVVSGPVSAMERAFDVHLFNYEHESGAYRGRVGSIFVPSSLKDIVVAVLGLDNRRAARRHRRPAGDIPRAVHPSAVPASWYKPAELATRYEFPPGDGAGQTIGVLEFGGAYLPSDLQMFCDCCGIDMPQVKPISADGTPTSRNDSATGEVMLDIEVVAGVCPKATIVVYFAQFSVQGWIAALDAAIHDAESNPGVVSVSWGYPETYDIWTPQAMQQVNESLLEAAHLGITVCASAGDDGSSDAMSDGKAYVDFPASSPYALAVGGTTIPLKNGQQPDIAWKEGQGVRRRNSDDGSTGGGVSAIFRRPSWQQSIDIPSVNAHAIAGRIVPDISANADWVASPYLLIVDGHPEPNGGTSAATPLIASLVTLINARNMAAARERVGYAAPQLYQPAAGAAPDSPPVGQLACRDVTVGDNITAQAGGYAAAPGYDAVSGWGTPLGNALATYLG
jgi:kumamolisin